MSAIIYPTNNPNPESANPMTNFFQDIEPLKFDPNATDTAFRHYNPDEVVMGKRMEDNLRFAVAYWHSFAWPGGDPFGGQTFDRP